MSYRLEFKTNIELLAAIKVLCKNNIAFKKGDNTNNPKSILKGYEMTRVINEAKKEIKEEKAIDTIQRFLDNAKSELLYAEITELVPMAFLISKFNMELIKDFAKENNIEHKVMFKTIISDVFDKNLVTTLNIALGNLEKRLEVEEKWELKRD